MRNLLAAIALPLILTGCGLPPIITVASTLAHGVSYAVSGKSMSDHALSAVTEEDCAVLRMFDGREICIDNTPHGSTTVMIAAIHSSDTWAPVDDLPITAQPVGDPVLAAETIAVAAVAPVAPAAPQARFTDATPTDRPTDVRKAVRNRINPLDGQVTVLGSYRDRANAHQALARLAKLQPRIMWVAVPHGTLYRVISDIPVARAKAAGVADAWSVRQAPVVQIAASIQAATLRP